MKSAVAAGHLCLDILPDLSRLDGEQFQRLFQPGHLITVGKPVFSTGGSVSNTGLALHRFGIPVRLMACIGEDMPGMIVRKIIGRISPALLKGLITDPKAATAYSLIISPRGSDRIFLHCPGANDSFNPSEIADVSSANMDLFHFGYPTLMRSMYQDDGRELVRLLSHLHSRGVTTSLDVTLPDPSTESGQCDWKTILQQALPHVDIFLPSLEELLFMLHRAESPGLAVPEGQPDVGLLHRLGDELLGMGVRIAGIKLGQYGLYIRTNGLASIQSMGKARPELISTWVNREVWAPGFRVQVAGTTAAGDTAIAGFLAGLLRDLDLNEATRMAAAAGACAVETVEKPAHLLDWEAMEHRVKGDWPQHLISIHSPDWRWDEGEKLWIGKKSAG